MSKELAAWGRPVMVFGQNVDNVRNLAGRLATADNQELVHFGLDSGQKHDLRGLSQHKHDIACNRDV